MTPIDDSRFDQLAQLNDKFKEASADGGAANFDPPPDGTYQALVDRFDFFESKDGEKLFLKTEITVQHHPQHAGRRADTVHQLNDPDRLDWLKKHLATLEVPGAADGSLDLSQIRPGSAALAAVCDTPVEVAVVTSSKTDSDGKPYRNVYVNSVLGPPLHKSSDIPNDGPPAGVGAADGSDHPFTEDRKIEF